jgi:tRNA threonylcarbamoyladenosine biosynthesis protein TsaB
MLVLAIETSTAQGSIALVGSEGVLAERAAHVPGGHLEWLIPSVDEMLAAGGFGPRSVDGIAVSLGPGGFTGLRIGLATAAAWARAARRPLVGVRTLDVIAWGTGSRGLVLAALDARRGEISAALFRLGVELRRLTPDVLIDPAGLPACLGPMAEPVLIAGDALAVCGQALLDVLAPWGAAAPRERWWPRAAVCGLLGRARLVRGEQDDPVGLVPAYARRPEIREFAP